MGTVGFHAFTFGGVRRKIMEVTKHWYGGGRHTGEPVHLVFEVRSHPKQRFLLRYDFLSRSWKVKPLVDKSVSP